MIETIILVIVVGFNWLLFIAAIICILAMCGGGSSKDNFDPYV